MQIWYLIDIILDVAHMLFYTSVDAILPTARVRVDDVHLHNYTCLAGHSYMNITFSSKHTRTESQAEQAGGEIQAEKDNAHTTRRFETPTCSSRARQV